MQWVKIQVDAIKSVDPNHLVTVGLVQLGPLLRPYQKPHAGCANYWTDGRYNEGPRDLYAVEARELTKLVDFVSIHFYAGYPYETEPVCGLPCTFGHGEWPNYPNNPGAQVNNDITGPCSNDTVPGTGCDDQLEYARELMRFIYAGKPILVGELGQVANCLDRATPQGPLNENTMSWFNTQVVLRTSGDVSGWVCWSFETWADENSADGRLTTDNGLFRDPVFGLCANGHLCPTAWGQAFKSLRDRVVTNNDPQDWFALLANQTIPNPPRRPATYGPFVAPTGQLTDSNYLALLGGRLQSGGLLDDATSIGPLTSMTSSNVADFAYGFNNTDVDLLKQKDARIGNQSPPFNPTVPEVMVTAQAYPCVITVRNTGTTTWSSPTFCLGQVLVGGLGPGSCYTLSPTSVPPGTSATASFSMTAPVVEGTYTYAFQMKDTSISPTTKQPFGEKYVVDVKVKAPSALAAPSPFVVGAGGGPNNAPVVASYVLDANRSGWIATSSFTAFPSDTTGKYGARVALGNLDGTGDTELAVAHGEQLVVGSTSTRKIEIYRKNFATNFPFTPTCLGSVTPSFSVPVDIMGVNVALGDVDGAVDSCAGQKADELLVAPGPVGTYPTEVKIFKVNVCGTPNCAGALPTTLLATITVPAVLGGASVGAIDVDGDGVKEVVIGSGRAFRAHVWVYRYQGGSFVPMGELDAFPPDIVTASTITDESRSFFSGSTGWSLSTPCQDPEHWSVNLSGGDLMSGSDGRQEILCSLGPYSNNSAHIYNEAWCSVLQYDSSLQQLVRRFTFGGWGDTAYGSSTAVADLHGDGARDILAAAGPDANANSLTHVLGTFGGSGLGPGTRPKLYGRREIQPFAPGLYGAHLTAREAPPLSPFTAPPGSPQAAFDEALRRVLEAPEPAFASESARGEVIDALRWAAGATGAGQPALAAGQLQALERHLESVVAFDDVRASLVQALQNARERNERARGNVPPVADAGEDVLTQTVDNPLGHVTLDGSASKDGDSPEGGTDIMDWFWMDGAEVIGNGRVVEASLTAGEHDVTLLVTDTVGNQARDVKHVTVLDGDRPRARARLPREVLWPPDHGMVDVTPTIVVEDMIDRSPDIALVGARSSEPDDAAGDDDGNTKDDIVLDADGKVLVRAERAESGKGRRYLLTYRVTDDAGNASTVDLSVLVPLQEQK